MGTNAELILQLRLTSKTGLSGGYPVLPIATSTPIRKPVGDWNVLNNAKKNYQLPLLEDVKLAVNTGGKVSNKKRKVRDGSRKGRNCLLRDVSSSDDDDNDDVETRKKLLLKSGSSKNLKRCKSQSRETVSSMDSIMSPVRKKNSMAQRQGRTQQEETSKETKTSDQHGNERKCSEGSNSIAERVTDCVCNVRSEEDSHSRNCPVKINGTNCATEGKSGDRFTESETPRRISKPLQFDHKFEPSHLKGKTSNSLKLSVKGARSQQSNLSASHEIFTENKENELRDSLKLGDDDDDDDVILSPARSSMSIMTLSSRKRHRSSLKTSKRGLKIKIEAVDKKHSVNNDSENVRPRRIKRKPREFWLTKSHNYRDSTKNDDTPKASNTTTNAGSPANNSSKQTKMYNMCTPSNDNEGNPTAFGDFVKDMSKMDFIRYAEGHNASTALGWQFSSFKCSILKIGPNSEVGGKTKHENSHLGGTVIKGKLSFQISGDETGMKKGQIFYVPPLTEWKIMNIGRTECIIYYWCGRF